MSFRPSNNLIIPDDWFLERDELELHASIFQSLNMAQKILGFKSEYENKKRKREGIRSENCLLVLVTGMAFENIR